METPGTITSPLAHPEALIESLHASDAVAQVADVAPPTTEAAPLTEAAILNKFPYVAIWILATLSLIAALQFSYAFTVPLISAILLHYALGRPVNWLEQVGVPRSIGAALVMCAALAVTGSLFYGLWGQAENLLDSLPRSTKRISDDFGKMRQAPGGTLRKVGEAAAAVTDMVNGQQPAAKPKSVAVAPNAASDGVNTYLIKGSVSALGSLATAAGIVLLAYFLLTAGDHFRRRIVKAAGKRLADRRITVETLDGINQAIGRYLGMLVVTNVILGILTSMVLFMLGVENAAAWGLMAALFHTIPYFGPIAIAFGVFVSSFEQIGTLGGAATAALSTLVVAAIVGTIAQSWMASRIARMNSTATFVALLFFGWLWGTAGLFLAIPIAVICKVIVDKLPGTTVVSDLMSV
jgi:predicted PurR-regulated permease PerM